MSPGPAGVMVSGMQLPRSQRGAAGLCQAWELSLGPHPFPLAPSLRAIQLVCAPHRPQTAGPARLSDGMLCPVLRCPWGGAAQALLLQHLRCCFIGGCLRPSWVWLEGTGLHTALTDVSHTGGDGGLRWRGRHEGCGRRAAEEQAWVLGPALGSRGWPAGPRGRGDGGLHRD